MLKPPFPRNRLSFLCEFICAYWSWPQATANLNFPTTKGPK